MLTELMDLLTKKNDRNPSTPNTERRARVVAVSSRKGGVGKTTTAVHLAEAASRWHDKRVLLVDLDPQSHVKRSLQACVSGDPPTPLSQTLLDKKGDILNSAIPCSVPGLWLVTSDEGMESAQLVLSTRIGREFVLRSSLARAETLFDLIVLDCPPNVDTLTLNALVASDYVVTPSDLSALSLQGVSDVVEAVDTIRDRLRLPVRVAGIVVTRVDARSPALNRQMEAVLNEKFGHLVISPAIPASTTVARACIAGCSAYSFDSTAKASMAYRNASAEVLNRLGS